MAHFIYVKKGNNYKMTLYGTNSWREYRDSVIELDGNRCSVCGRRGSEVILQVHHKKYIISQKEFDFFLKIQDLKSTKPYKTLNIAKTKAFDIIESGELVEYFKNHNMSIIKKQKINITNNMGLNAGERGSSNIRFVCWNLSKRYIIF